MKTNLLKIGVAVLTIALLVGTVTFCKREFGEQDLTVEVTGIKVYPSDLATSGGSVTQLRAVVLPVGAQDTTVVWSTNRPEVATVDKHGKVTAMGVGFASITVRHANKNYSARCDVNVKTDAYSVTGITLNKTSLTLSMANYKSATLQAFIMPEYARNKTVTWSSDNTAVVTVSATGVVTAVSAGSARITAKTADGGKTAYCSVTVAAAVPVSDVKLSPQNLPLYIGDKEQLQATILPADAANKAVTWLSCNPNIATVSSSGLVTGVGAGMTTIIVTTVQGSNTAFCNVTVSPHVTSITLKPSSLVMVKGAQSPLTATVLPSNASNKKVTWSSDKPNVATVDTNGVVTAKQSIGTAMITATTVDGNKKATCVVRVRDTVHVIGVSLHPTPLELTVGIKGMLIATITPDSATNKNITWSSSHPDIASVDGYGVITAHKVGTATVTVTTEDGGKTATCLVTVIARSNSVTGITMSGCPTSLTMLVGQKDTLTATIAPDSATYKVVAWKSNDSKVATVSTAGVVTAHGAGTAVITATAVADITKKAACTVRVIVPTTGIILTPSMIRISPGDTRTLTATVLPANATNKAVTWSSRNPSVATVSSTGEVTAHNAGTTIITVTTVEGGYKAYCTVIVSPLTQTQGIWMECDYTNTWTMVKGGEVTKKWGVWPDDVVDKSVTWSSSNQNVATINNNGKLTAKNAGQTTITVATNDGGASSTFTLNVINPTITVTSQYGTTDIEMVTVEGLGEFDWCCPFNISRYEVTQKLWKVVMGSLPAGVNASVGIGDSLPVYGLDSALAVEFIEKLNQLTGLNFQIPFNTEWLFAYSGGFASQGYWYSGSNDLDEVAWHCMDIGCVLSSVGDEWNNSNSGGKVHPVGTKKPNELGIYDMEGNAKELGWILLMRISTIRGQGCSGNGAVGGDVEIGLRIILPVSGH